MVRITTVPKMLSASDAFGEETSRRYPFVMVMKSTDFRQLPHRPYLPWLNDSRVGRVHRQRSMRTPGVIISHNRLRVFRSAHTAPLGRVASQERWLRVGSSEKYAAR